MIRKLIAGNWKMNGSFGAIAEIKAIEAGAISAVDLLICPPFTLISEANAVTNNLKIGAQDCHESVSGAYTGNLSAEMLVEAGASSIIVGHSERRQYHGETDETVANKAKAAWRAAAIAIICVGETKDERVSNVTLKVIGKQLAGSVPDGANSKNCVIAYEPVWAIGTGLTPTAKDVEEVHGFMRKELVVRFGKDAEKIKLLYGGSVKPSNANELLNIANVNGALVGGASLKAVDFLAIANAV